MPETRFLTERQCMELAYQISSDSRSDSGHSTDPFVGAVLRGPNGELLGKACRAQLFEGDHAEYTLLTETRTTDKFKGCTLFATLEPCTAASRNETISCSELIAKTEIKDVYVGMFDPNMKVTNMGVRYLIEHGISVHPFDQDLREKIIASNEGRLVNATALLGDIKRVYDSVYVPLMDTEAVKYYFDHNKRGIKNENDFLKMLLDRKLISVSKNKIEVSDSIKVSFYKDPAYFVPNSRIMFIDESQGEVEFAPFKKQSIPLMLAEQAMREALGRWGVSFQGGYSLLKEAFVNAILHRDYENTAYVYFRRKTANTIQIENPIRANAKRQESIKTFDAIPEPGNEWLVELALDVGLIDMQGRGLSTLKAASLKKRVSVDIKDEEFLVCKIIL
jgi:pyrimidine deaminase RibD-like protein